MNKNTYALVTGASRGIGKSIAQLLLEQGGIVIGTARSSAFPDEFVENPDFEGIHVDLANPDAIKSKLKPIFDRDTAPNVLINNAGIFLEAGFDLDDESWLDTLDQTMQVNLRSAALLSKWALNRWKEEGGGYLINVSSRAAYRGDTQEYSAYAASKGALVAFTKSVARDFGEHGVSAYSIAPGFIKTDMAMGSIDVYGEDYLTEGMAFDEITSPEEVGELVAFLASGKVPHMTGATFHINGGSYMI
ncbi:NAD(P)-dependent dehydrogenase, short-chain alcohol dehydrogenase family [Fodinibius salinus]|uniref:NAD(P)-dependent dehydrogenase, short-chain alcohol dehydrogenase family n=1 Tax=Fodinibius salinus TaxID=860790 RepID=A0A5D3YRP9_9BACT|nr:SDR family oxidoreductase [Fodinibius salinus]TYP95211.1 NAD(P)-dependent dehydrogenase, short-chain alcohol dehydrogenase family [Fodinibius salinus]